MSDVARKPRFRVGFEGKAKVKVLVSVTLATETPDVTGLFTPLPKE